MDAAPESDDVPVPEHSRGSAEPMARLPERSHTSQTAAPAEPTAPVQTGGFKDALFDGAENFVRKLEPLVRRIAGASGIHPVAVLAQAALETGWGAKVPHDGDGQPSYNLFGVKSHDWDGPSVDVTTLEHQFDRFVRKVESFRAYEGVAEAVEDYVDFLKGNQRYSRALDVAQDPPAFADALQEAGYATDPGYADKLKALQRQIADMLGGS
jgi:flagellar protein FlgJ